MTAVHVVTPTGKHAELVPLVGGYLRVGSGAPEIVGEADLGVYRTVDEQREGPRRTAERRKNRGATRRVVVGRRRRDVCTLREDLDVAVVRHRLRQHAGRRTPPGGVRP